MITEYELSRGAGLRFRSTVNLPAHRPDKSANLPGYSQPQAANMLNVGERSVVITWDRPKILLRIALVLVLGLFVPSAKATVIIYVDLDAQQMTVTNNGDTLVWKVSSGREGFETPTGSFSVQRLDANHFSDEYDQSPMPYSIFFYQGLAIHGTNQGGLGRPASHGCVRLAIPHARMLYSWVKKDGASIEISGMASEILDTDDDFVTDHRRTRKRLNSPSNPSWITVFPPE